MVDGTEAVSLEITSSFGINLILGIFLRFLFAISTIIYDCCHAILSAIV